MARCTALLLLAVLGLAFVPAGFAAPGVRHASFNHGWRFMRGDAENAETPEFNDGDWPKVRLPHDWAISGPFDASLNPHTGALPISGIGWYRKSFALPVNAA